MIKKIDNRNIIERDLDRFGFFVFSKVMTIKNFVLLMLWTGFFYTFGVVIGDLKYDTMLLAFALMICIIPSSTYIMFSELNTNIED